MPYDCERDIRFHAVYQPLDGGGRDCFFRCGDIFISLAVRQAYLDERPGLANNPHILVSARKPESLKDYMVSAELRELGATPVKMFWPPDEETKPTGKRGPAVILPGTREPWWKQ